MRIVRLAVMASAFALAAPALVQASDQAVPSKDNSTPAVTAPRQFATLKGVKAVPMAAKELKAVKGQHVHFWNPGAPFPFEEPHLAGNVKTEKNWSNLYGQGDVANSYHGLCNAASNGSSAIFINPGGGCGF